MRDRIRPAVSGSLAARGRRRVVKRGVLVAVALVVSVVPCRSSTVIFGGSIGTTTWAADGSPYIVLGDVEVLAGATLTIEPGVAVQFNASDGTAGGRDSTRCEFIVSGSLLAAGTAVSPIIFRSNGTPAASVWYGVVAAPTAEDLTLDHVSLEHAREAIRVESPGSVVTLGTVAFADSSHWDLHLIGAGSPQYGTITLSKVSGDLLLDSGAVLQHAGGVGYIAGNLAVEPGARYSLALASVADYDQFEVQGEISLGGGLAVSAPGLTALVGDAFTVLDNNEVDPVVSTFAGMPEGANLSTPYAIFSISYLGGSGNDVVLTILELFLFRDDFESGDTDLWSSTSP